MGNKTSKSTRLNIKRNGSANVIVDDNVIEDENTPDTGKDSMTKVSEGNQHNKKDFVPKTLRNLIVDDARYNRIILSQYLKKIGIECDEASNGHEALLMEDPDIYDIIWMDLRMPIMDGFECTQILREKNYKGIVIGVTGDVSENNMEMCYTVGMNHVILKPIIFDELMHLYYIKKYLELQNTERVT